MTLDIGGALVEQGRAGRRWIRTERDALHATHERARGRHPCWTSAAGTGTDEVYFSDLGHEYVTINAEYHT